MKLYIGWEAGMPSYMKYEDWEIACQKVPSRGKKVKSNIPCAICGKKAKKKKITKDGKHNFYRCVLKDGKNMGYLCNRKSCYTFLTLRLL